MKGFLLLVVFCRRGPRRRALLPEVPPGVSRAGRGRGRRAGEGGRERTPAPTRHGARRLARNGVFIASAPGAPDEAAAAEVPRPGPATAPPAEERAPAPPAPGGASVSEAPPDDVFGPRGRHRPRRRAAGAPPVAAPEPVKLRAADLKMVWQGEDCRAPEPCASTCRTTRSGTSCRRTRSTRAFARRRTPSSAASRGRGPTSTPTFRAASP